MWQVAVYDRAQHEQFRSVRARFALSRSGPDEPWTFSDIDDPRKQPPPSHAVLRMRAEGDHLRLECHGVQGHVELDDGAAFWAGKVVQLALPCLFHIQDTWFEIQACADGEVGGLEPLHRTDESSGPRLAAAAGPDADTVARWLSSVGQLHRTAASAPEFFATAARLTLESTGLDAAMILTRENDAWRIAGSSIPAPQFGISYDVDALALVYDHPEVWRCPARTVHGEAGNDARQQSVVVAPVFGSEGEVVAAVYGVRHGRGDNRRRGIRPLEARVVELMSDAVGLGMARRAQEIESARQQVMLEQAFSPAVIEHLRRRPEALAGCTREVTLLFADLRGFTTVAESLHPEVAYELLGEVLEWMTQAVMDYGGVVIDYYGDGLSAMWNAPLDMPGHADLACAAALHMLETLPAMSNQWRTRLGQAIEMGIGIHAGEVQVGNAGTRRRLKYGPRGSNVNIASRVQAATRQIDVPLLATEAVRRRLSGRFVTLRACTAKLPGLEQPIELFTVLPATDGHRLQLDMERYATALSSFEDGDLDTAERILADLIASGPATPAAFLAQQAHSLRQSALGRRATDQFGQTTDAVIEILAK
jgi:adenylate cyclase